MPGNPWIFSGSRLPAPGVPAFQGEHSLEILTETQSASDRDPRSAAPKAVYHAERFNDS